MPAANDLLVLIATYNEIENLPNLVAAIHDQTPHAHILVVDDNSPDGTGKWCDLAAAADDRLRVIHRSGKLGLGTAAVAGFRYALEHDYELVLTLDADFSHPPERIPAILADLAAGGATIDVQIGSRYVPGGGVSGWPVYRRWMSRAINAYARLLLRLPARDCSGAFRCYRVAALRKLELRAIRGRGYVYLEELLWRLRRQGANFAETPFVYVDRQRGQTKINWREALAAVLMILRLALIGR